MPEAENPVPPHEVALVELQMSMDDWPEVIEVGLAVSATPGGGGGAVTVTVALAVADPPLPLHVTE
jgi:hypothetical protein